MTALGHETDMRPALQAKTADVARAVMLPVDVDDPSDASLAKLKTFDPRRTAIIFSGGRYQAFSLLEEPLHDLTTAEPPKRGLASKLGGDNCHNADCIMRVPGTINWSNAKKRKAGRKPVLANVL